MGKIYKEKRFKVEMVMVKDKVDGWKEVAEIWLKKDIKVFIKDSSDDYYFADILFVGEDSIRVECFGPEKRKGLKKTIYWPLVVEFKEYEVDNG